MDDSESSSEMSIIGKILDKELILMNEQALKDENYANLIHLILNASIGQDEASQGQSRNI